MIKVIVCTARLNCKACSETSSVNACEQHCFPMQRLVWASSTEKRGLGGEAVSFGRKCSYFNGYDVMNY